MALRHQSTIGAVRFNNQRSNINIQGLHIQQPKFKIQAPDLNGLNFTNYHPDDLLSLKHQLQLTQFEYSTSTLPLSYTAIPMSPPSSTHKLSIDMSTPRASTSTAPPAYTSSEQYHTMSSSASTSSTSKRRSIVQVLTGRKSSDSSSSPRPSKSKMSPEEKETRAAARAYYMASK